MNPPARPWGPTRSVLTLQVLALASGGCALAYEILYMRALTTLLGDVFYVHAALLSTFLLGIGIGAKVAHRWWRWLFLIEIFTGLYAFWFSPLSRWLSEQPLMASLASRPLWTILSTVALLLLPSLLIGCTLPLLSAYVKMHREGRLAFQGIYKAYNLGALLGIFSVEFLLVRAVGVALSLALAGALNFTIGLILLAMRPRRESLRPVSPVTFQKGRLAALWTASFSSAVFQMFFLKLTYLVFQPHRENFSIALSVILGGIFLGAWVATRWPVRFETLLLLFPLSIGIIYLNYWPLYGLYQSTAAAARLSEWLILAHKLAFASLFALVPMMLLGGLLPALMRAERRVDQESGHLLWISSLGNACGYLFYVLVGHPLLGNALLLAGMGGLVLLASLPLLRWRPSRTQAACMVLGVVLAGAAAVRWEERNFYLAPWAGDLSPEDRVRVFKSGAESATLLSSPEYDWVSYNGHPSVYVQQGGLFNRAETLSGVIPALGAPSLERALVLGMGTGITAGTTAQIFQHTDVVEINQAFFQMMPLLREASFDLQNNPAAKLHLADARTFLIGREALYDVVVNSIPAPSYFSAAKIYTAEFFERVARALKPGGVFCTWLSVPNVSEEGLLTLLATLRAQFAHCELRLLRQGYYMATCSSQPVTGRGFAQVPVSGLLRNRLRVSFPGFDLEEFFQDLRLSPDIFADLPASPLRLNRDDHPVLEFMVVRNFQLGRLGRDLFLDEQALFNVDPVGGAARSDPGRLARKARVYRFSGRGFFDRNFLPLLLSSPENREAWLHLMGEGTGGEGSGSGSGP